MKQSTPSGQAAFDFSTIQKGYCQCGCGQTVKNLYRNGHAPRRSRLDAPGYRDKAIARFLDRIDKNGPIPSHCPELGHCHLWIGQVDSFGYGIVSYLGKHWRVTHLVLMLSGEPLAAGMEALHRCDNPPCCNRDHLFSGTQADNVHDMHAKGRSNKTTGDDHWTRQHPESVFRGSACKSAKLTDDAVRAIRARYAAGGVTTTQLGAEFGVTHRSISLIVRRKGWVHVA